MDEECRLEALNKTITQCRKSSFYHDRLPDRPLGRIEELKSLPFTSKEDIRTNSPFGLLCVPVSELYQYHETFGTTGTPSSVWLTKEDGMDMARRANMYGVEFTKNDIVLVRFPYALSTVAHFIHAAAQSKDACVIPASSRNTVTPFTRVVDLMQRLNVTILAALPLQALLIAETAEVLGYKPNKDFPHLRALYTAGEVMTSSRRNVLERVWGVPVVDNYGMTETGPMAIDCSFGCLHPIGDSFIFEVLDDEFREEVSPGEIGNLVVTTLTRYAVPLVRYMTGDRVRLYNKACPCGEKLTLQVRGRKKDVIETGGRCLDMWDLGDMAALVGFGRYWAAGSYQGGLKLIVEQEKDEDAIKPETLQLIKEKYGDGVELEVVPCGCLHNREELLAVSEVGKPKYIYTEEEMAQKGYAKAMRI